MLENIPLFGYTTFYLSIQQMGICFHILSDVDMNIPV